MAQWRGWRKSLIVLAFVGPTLLGIMIFNIYPILFNTFISFTNRNQFHPTPDCSIWLTSVLEPTCWKVFAEHSTTGLATPFRIQDPLFNNYSTLLGQFFSAPILMAFLRVVLCLIPLIIANWINKRLEKDLSRSVPSWAVSLGGIAGALALFLPGNQTAVLEITQPSQYWQALFQSGPVALGLVTNSGDFFVVNLRTILYVACCIPLFFIVGLSLALLLNVHDLPGRTFFRVILIVPWAASTVAIMMSLVWKFFFQETGTINQILSIFDVPTILFLQNPTVAFVVIVLVNVWYSYPFFMVTILGALQSVPGELYEAAEVDGASWWQRLRAITLPLLRPAVIPVIVLSSITTFQMFGTVWAITGGGPSRGAGTPGATELTMVYAYKQVFQTQAYGKMGAFALIMFVLLFGATLYSLRVSRITKGAYE